MVVTVINLPLVLHRLLGGASVSLWDIARSLILMMLLLHNLMKIKKLSG